MKCLLCNKETTPILKFGEKKSVTSLGKTIDSDAEVFLCGTCTHCQTIPSINLADYYANHYKSLSSSDVEDDLYSLKDGIPLFRNKHMANVLIQKLTQLKTLHLDDDPHILDFGCGKALAMRHVHATMPQTKLFLYDISLDYIKFWTDFIPKERLSCHAVPKAWAKSFDVVTSFFSLEHIKYPALELEKIWSLLKPDGIIYIVVPNMYSQNIADMLVIDHIHHYSEESMQRLLASTGYDLLNVDHQSHSQASIYIARKKAAASKAIFAEKNNQIFNQARSIAIFWANFNRELLAFETARSNERSSYYIVGAGILGTYIFSLFRFPDRLKGFIDSNGFKQSKGWLSKPVFPPGTIQADAHTIVYSGFNSEQVKTLLPSMLPVGIKPSNIWTIRNVQEHDATDQ